MMGLQSGPGCLELLSTWRAYSEQLLGLRLGRAFGRGGFGAGGEECYHVLESFTYLSSEPVGILKVQKTQVLNTKVRAERER